MTKKLEDLIDDEVIAELNTQQPDWMYAWADQRDLLDALQKLPGDRVEQKQLLINRQRPRIQMALRAVYCAMSR